MKYKIIFALHLLISILFFVFAEGETAALLYFLLSGILLLMPFIIGTQKILNLAKKYDTENYEIIRFALMNRGHQHEAKSQNPVVQNEIDEYLDGSSFSTIASFMIYIVVSLRIN